MTQALQPVDLIEQVLIHGDLSKMSPENRLAYYKRVTGSLSLNPYTKPFEFLVLNGKTVLYCTKNATDQLRDLHGVSIEKIERELVDETYVVTAYARDKDGRVDSDVGAVYLGKSVGDDRVNRMLKAVTKAKRRVTLSICGLGMLDESEVETVADAQPITVDHETGEVLERPKALPKIQVIDDPNDRIWQRWLEVTKEAEELGMKYVALTLPMERKQLVSAGLALGALVDKAKKARLIETVDDARYQVLSERIEEASALGIDVSNFGVALPVSADIVGMQVGKLEGLILKADEGQ